MKYSAITYTADPHIGLVSPGEMLTEEQVNALGTEKIAELVERKVLMAWPEERNAAFVAERTPAPEPTGDKKESKEENPEEENPEDETEDEDDQPELDAMEDIVSDDAPEPAAPKKNGGRRKAK